jgi:hypothetical protein
MKSCSLFIMSIFLITQFGSFASADGGLGQAQQQIYTQGINYFDQSVDTSSGGGCSTGATTLTGSDSEQEAWNYFKGKGLSDAQAAGVMGNFEQESGFNPEINENGSGDSETQPLTGGSDGWGLAQWTYPYQTVQTLFNQYNISGQIYELGPQLDLVWAQMNNTSPNGTPDILKTIQTMSSATSVATYFDSAFEGGSDPNGIRETDATVIQGKYGGTGATTSDSVTGGCSQEGAVDCTSATGNAKILCEAEQWKGIYYEYGGGHQSLSAFEQACPDLSNPTNNQPSGGAVNGDPADESGNPSPCAVDCSGLVDLSTDMAFGSQGVDMGGGSVTGIQASKYWKKISFNQLQPGDIVTLVTSNNEHTEIVDTYDPSSGELTTFGAHSTGQIDGTVSSPVTYWNGAYRYIGPGSDSDSTS